MPDTFKVRPDSIIVDDKKQLHNWNGPACTLYNTRTDETVLSIYAVHNFILNDDDPLLDKGWLITKEKPLTVMDIDKEKNIEIRRIMLELYGIANYVRDGKFETLHTDVDNFGRPRTLVRKKGLVGDEDIVGVFVKNSSPNGKFEKTKTFFKPLKEFSDFEQKRIVHKYENTGKLKPSANGELALEVTIEKGTFIPDLDKAGNIVYKDYFLQVHPTLCPLIDTEARLFGTAQEMTCHNAVASTFGLYGAEYAPDVET